jgi:hypothetical protein
MKKNKKPEKLQNLLEKIKECIETGNYILTAHVLARQAERAINLPAILHVLRNGYEEKRKTSFDNEQNAWKYAIRGKTLRDEDIRIIIGFDESGMLIITVMHVEEL